jgi:hypothetical protein
VTLALRWYWRYGTLEVEEHDSLGEALSCAEGAQERGTEALAGIEVWDEDGYRFLQSDEVWRLVTARLPDPAPAPPRSVAAVVAVQSPGGGWAEDRFYNIQEAEEYAERLRSVLGHERVTLRAL